MKKIIFILMITSNLMAERPLKITPMQEIRVSDNNIWQTWIRKICVEGQVFYISPDGVLTKKTTVQGYGIPCK